MGSNIRKYEEHQVSVVGVAECRISEIKSKIYDKPDLAIDVHFTRQSVQLGNLSVDAAINDLKDKGYVNVDYRNATDDDPQLVGFIRDCLNIIDKGDCSNYPKN